MSDAVAGRALLEEARGADGAGVGGVGVGRGVGGEDESFEAASGPEGEAQGAASDRVLANGAEVVFVGLAVLAEEPFLPREGGGADEIDEDPGDEDEGGDDEDVLEIATGEVLVHDEEHFGERGDAEGVGERGVGRVAPTEEEGDGDDQQGNENGEFVEGETPLVTGGGLLPFDVHGAPLVVEASSEIALSVLEVALGFGQSGDLVVGFLVFSLGLEEELLGVAEGLLFEGGRGNAALVGEALKLEQLIHRPHGVVGTVAEHGLGDLLGFDGAAGFFQLKLESVVFGGESRVDTGAFDVGVDGAGEGADVADDEAEQPEDERSEQRAEDGDEGAVGPRAAAGSRRMHTVVDRRTRSALRHPASGAGGERSQWARGWAAA